MCYVWCVVGSSVISCQAVEWPYLWCCVWVLGRPLIYFRTVSRCNNKFYCHHCGFHRRFTYKRSIYYFHSAIKFIFACQNISIYLFYKMKSPSVWKHSPKLFNIIIENIKIIINILLFTGMLCFAHSKEIFFSALEKWWYHIQAHVEVTVFYRWNTVRQGARAVSAVVGSERGGNRCIVKTAQWGIWNVCSSGFIKSTG